MLSIELFAGAGGLGIGASRAGFIPTKIVEWDRWCCDTIRENRAKGVEPIADWPLPTEADVRTLDFSEYESKLDLVTGGPPCQPFSLGGKHKGHADARDMWPEAVRVVRETRPRAFVFENVKGLTRQNFANYLSYIVHQLTYPEIVRKDKEFWSDHLRRLEQHSTYGKYHGLKYNLVYEVLDAANYGVPQRRERIFFVGFRSDQNIGWSFPHETHSREALLWDQGVRGSYWDRHGVSRKERQISLASIQRLVKLTEKPLLAPWRTVRDAIGDLPVPRAESAKSSAIANHRLQPGARAYPGHTGSPLDFPAKALKAGVHGVPGGENMLARVDGSVRYFTIREGARLQTFPDNYHFHGSWSESMRQLGNAVPAYLAEIVIADVRKHLAEKASCQSAK
jgi:DNA (cytosine-5)-methyltransferase 1